MDPTPSPDRLTQLLLDLLDTRELRFFAEGLPQGSELLAGVSDSASAAQIARAIVQRGTQLRVIDDGFFVHLLGLRPRDEARIDPLRASWAARPRTGLIRGDAPVPGMDPAPSQLFDGRTRLFDYHPPEGIAPQLDRWIRRPGPVTFAVLTGSSGAGKTRTAVEWSAQLRGGDWEVGFLAGVPRWPEALRLPGQRVVVVDDAGDRLDVLQDLLDSVDADPPPALSLRVLLVARTRDDLWAARASGAVRRVALPDDTLWLHLAPIPAAARQERFERAVRTYAMYAKGSGKLPQMLDLAQPRFGRPLFLQMAAAAWMDRRPVASIAALLEDTLDRERDAWERAMANLGSTPLQSGPSPHLALRDLLSRFVAWTGLVGGVGDPEEVTALLRRLDPTLSAPEALTPALLAVLSPLYGQDRGLRPMVPRPVFDTLLKAEFEADPNFAIQTITRLRGHPRHPRAVRTLLGFLDRTASRDPVASAWLAALIADDPTLLAPAALAASLASGGPTPTLLRTILRDHADVAEALLPGLMGASPLPSRWMALAAQAILKTQHTDRPPGQRAALLHAAACWWAELDEPKVAAMCHMQAAWWLGRTAGAAQAQAHLRKTGALLERSGPVEGRTPLHELGMDFGLRETLAAQ